MTKAVLIGSRAAKFWFADARTPGNDFDFLIDHDFLVEWVNQHRNELRHTHYLGDDVVQVELRLGGTLGFDNSRYASVQRFLALNADMPTATVYGIDFNIAAPETLLAVKRSHVNFRHNWHKHIRDYTFLKAKGLQLTAAHEEALALRRKEREDRKDFKKPGSLAKSNEAFFAQSDGGVRRKFVHDELHDVVAYYERPLFTRAKRDQSKALLDRDLFQAFSFEDKCRLVREEAYVIGLERIVIPLWHNQYLLHQRGCLDGVALDERLADQAYSYALMRLCTDLTKGWFRDFATENYLDLADRDRDFVGLFLAAFASQRLKFKV